MPPMNIIYIHSHDTGRYIQPYGHAVPAPNIQKLAEQGVLFRQAFCAGPTCSASRAALLTGQCAHSAGMIGLAHRGFSLKDYNQHIVHTLKKAGYHSVLCGMQHEIGFSRNPDALAKLGYHERLDAGDNMAAGVAGAAHQWLKKSPKQPFFLSVGFTETHRDFPPAGPFEDERYTLPPAPLPDTPETRRDMAEFKITARRFDSAVGFVMGALDDTGLAQNTLVICTTDHGIAFPGMKCNLTDHGIGVMLIMRGPRGFAGGKVIDGMVSQIDVFPTICELLGLSRPAWLRGKSIMPLITGQSQDVNDEIFSEVTYHAAYEPMRAVRTKRWKYIRRFGGRTAPVLPNCDDSLSKTLWMDNGWRNRQLPHEQLFDLVFDPNETANLAGDPAYSKPLAEMSKRLDDWMKRTDDPLLKGEPVPAPAGSQVNDPDGISPREPAKTIGE
ncbi:MAG: sulfatase [Planctomycetes bacterium]|nr:sulfatase [Planctomycetota bacterium]